MWARHYDWMRESFFLLLHSYATSDDISRDTKIVYNETGWKKRARVRTREKGIVTHTATYIFWHVILYTYLCNARKKHDAYTSLTHILQSTEFSFLFLPLVLLLLNDFVLFSNKQVNLLAYRNLMFFFFFHSLCAHLQKRAGYYLVALTDTESKCRVQRKYENIDNGMKRIAITHHCTSIIRFLQ